MSAVPPPVTVVGAAFCDQCRWDCYMQDDLQEMAAIHCGAAGHVTHVALTSHWVYQPLAPAVARG